jgi:TPR repeat protein
MFAGAAISFASRVPALRALRWAHLIGLVPDLEALHAGERAANNIRKVRNRLGIGAGIILLVIIGVSYLAGNIERDRALESGKALTTSIDDMLHGAVRILESGQREDKEERMRAALGTLRRLRVIAESADGRPVPGAGTAAGHYLQKYKDDTEAFVQTADGRAWARANAYSGIDAAQTALWLGRLAERGVAGNQPELSKAYEYFEQAQVAGNPNAPAALQRVAEKLVASKSAEERARGYKFFQIKADEGDPSGWLWLGRRYLKGDGVDKDVPAGALTLMKALNQSSNVPVALRAFADLGTIDRAQADVWRALDNKAAEFAGMKDAAAKAAGYAYLEKRAAEGDPGAQLWTGYRYTEGDGVAADIYAARYWLRKAASQTSDAQVRKRALALLRVANPSAR